MQVVAGGTGVQTGATEEMLPAIDRALEKETDAEIKELLSLTRASVQLTSKDKAARMKVRAQGKATEMSGQLRQSQLVQGDPVRRRWPLAAAAAGVVLVGSVLVRRRRRRA